MAQRGKGAIVTVASVVGVAGGPLHAYGPAKAALLNLTQGLAAEWGRSGVRVNAVSPGFVETPAVARGVAEHVLDPARMAGASALGRMVQPGEIAAAVAFLASDDASFMTASQFVVDGGITGAYVTPL